MLSSPCASVFYYTLDCGASPNVYSPRRSFTLHSSLFTLAERRTSALHCFSRPPKLKLKPGGGLFCCAALSRTRQAARLGYASKAEEEEEEEHNIIIIIIPSKVAREIRLLRFLLLLRSFRVCLVG